MAVNGIPLWVKDYIGIPFARHGRTHTGVDCWGLVRLIYADQFGIHLPDYSAEYDNPRDAAEVGAVIAAEKDIMWPVDQPAFGDVVLIRLDGWPSHVGLVVAPGHMLHVTEGASTAYESYDSIKYGRRVLGFYRYGQGVEHHA